MRRLWLLFAQTITVAFGLYLVIATVRPDWLQRIKPVRFSLTAILLPLPSIS